MAKILIVDDEVVIHQSLQSALAGDGHAFCFATDIEDGCRFLGTDVFDLVILDIGLPGGSGLDLLEWLRTRDNETRVILITGSPDARTWDIAQTLVIEAYVTKPFGIAQIRALVDAALTPDILDEDAEGLSIEEEFSEWGSPSLLDEGDSGRSVLDPMFEQRLELPGRLTRWERKE